MAYTYCTEAVVPEDEVGLTFTGQFYDSAFVVSGSSFAVSSNHFGNGQYGLTVSISDGFQGFLTITKSSDGEVLVSAFNPQDAENMDVKASDIEAGVDTANTVLVAIAAYVDTEIAAIKAKTDLLTFTGSALQSTLVAAGLDAVTLESGVNARQGLCIIFASQAGVLSGADLSGDPQTIIIKGGNTPGTTRITCSADGVGNRTTVTLNLPA